MTTAITSREILIEIAIIASKYGVDIGQNIKTGEIVAEHFSDVGRLTHFRNDVSNYLSSITKINRFKMTTNYNPYTVRIKWG